MPNYYGGNGENAGPSPSALYQQTIGGAQPGAVTLGGGVPPAIPASPCFSDANGLGFPLQMEPRLDLRHAQLHEVRSGAPQVSPQQMTFGMLYAYTENFVLPISHDEVVHGKNRSPDRMPGVRQKFTNLRAYYGFMLGASGQAAFMGCEFARARSGISIPALTGIYWKRLDNWHNGVQRLVRDLNHCRQRAPLYERDYRRTASNGWWSTIDNSVFAFARYDSQGNELIAINALPRCRAAATAHRHSRAAVFAPRDPQYRFAPLSRQRAGNQGRSLQSGRQPWPRFLYQRDVAAIVDICCGKARHDRS